MPRSWWKGAIQVSLLTIPARAVSLGNAHDVKFNLLHRGCGRPPVGVRRCHVCGVEDIPAEDIVRGYKIARDQWVVLTDDELDALPLPSAGVIDVQCFADAAFVPPTVVEKTLYLGPDKGGEKAFDLLRQAMAAAGKVAVGKMAKGSKEHLVSFGLGPWGVRGPMLLHILFYADELTKADEVPAPPTFVFKPGEVALAQQIVEALQPTGGLETIKDGTHDALTALINAKVQGVEIKRAVQQYVLPEVDLTDLLAKTVEKIKAGG